MNVGIGTNFERSKRNRFTNQRHFKLFTVKPGFYIFSEVTYSMPAGGVLDPVDKINADAIVIPEQETDDPNTPADERLLRKEEGFFTPPGIPDFDKDGFSDESDPDDDNNRTLEPLDPAPRNPSVPVAVNTEDEGDEVTSEVLQ